VKGTDFHISNNFTNDELGRILSWHPGNRSQGRPYWVHDNLVVRMNKYKF
jgi:hypothetical protein